MVHWNLTARQQHFVIYTIEPSSKNRTELISKCWHVNKLTPKHNTKDWHQKKMSMHCDFIVLLYYVISLAVFIYFQLIAAGVKLSFENNKKSNFWYWLSWLSYIYIIYIIYIYIYIYIITVVKQYQSSPNEANVDLAVYLSTTIC